MSMETLVSIRNLKVSFRLDRAHMFELEVWLPIVRSLVDLRRVAPR